MTGVSMNMNEKDKEAFEKWWRENMPNPDWLSSDHSTDVCKAWEAACEFKQREIDELEETALKQNQENDLLWSSNKKLQAENAKLKECVKFYADYRNHGFPGDAEISDYEKDKLSFFKQGKRARQVLKELDSNQLGEGKNE